MNGENAILMAAGLGSRMLPLTRTTPKPLVRVNDVPLIETVLDGLSRRGVDQIYVVTGHLGRQFFYLEKKYPQLTILPNEEYKTVNNISSLYRAREVLKQGNCFICEADLLVTDRSVFDAKLENSCYYGKFVPGYSEDWVFDLDDQGVITRVGKKGTDCYNMTGISWFTGKDARILYDCLMEEYGAEGYETLFWDDVVNRHIDCFSLRVHEIEERQVVEIDTLDELERARKGE